LLSVAHSDWTALAVRKPFVKLLIEVVGDADGRILGEGVMPFMVRASDDKTPAPVDPATVFFDEFISDSSQHGATVSGLAGLEGPYEQWDLPLFRWAKQPVVRISVPGDPKVKRLRLTFSLRLQARDEANLEAVYNGRVMQTFHLYGRTVWLDKSIEVTPSPGENVFELRERASSENPDWLAYLDENPDVKQFVVSQNQPMEEGAQQHYELHGRAEGRPLPMRASTGAVAVPPDSLYFAYRTLRITGLAEH